MSSSTARRWRTGLQLGALSSLWVASPSKYFALGFGVLSFLAHDEFVRMMTLMNIKPAVGMSRVLGAMFFVAALRAPHLISPLLTLSMFALFVSHLTRKDRKPEAVDIFASIFGTVYLGYLPSFWVALHRIKSPSYYGVQMGKFLTVWTLMIVIAADAGGYFVGRSIGSHKLSTLSYAAGVVSPNKTIEGVIGGVIASLTISLIGAKLLQLPSWIIVGSTYGLTISIASVLGDLMASALKRSANCKDSGNLLPGHGGVLDRLDSHVMSGAVAVHLLSLLGVFAFE